MRIAAGLERLRVALPGARRAPEAVEDLARVGERHVDAEQGAHPRRAQRDGLALREGHARHDRPGHRRAAGEHGEQRPGVGEHVGHAGRIDAPLEAVARLGVEPVPPRAPPHAARPEVGALEQDPLRRGPDLARPAAHHAGEGDRPVAVGDDQVVRIERAVHAVEREELLARARAPHHDAPPAHEIEIERVHRVPELEQDQVGDVDDVGDGADAQALEPVADPRRRGRDGHVGDDRRAVVRAALGVLDGDAHQLGHRARRDAGRRVRLRRRERQLVERRRLAREPHVSERVGPVRREVDVEDPVVRRRQRLDERRARLRRPRREDEDARVARVRVDRLGRLLGAGREPELELGAEHPLARDAADLARRERHPERRQYRPDRRQRDLPARLGHVGRAADDALQHARAAIDGHQPELRAGRMRLDGPHLRDDHGLARAVLGDPVDGEPRAREPLGELGGRGLEIRDERADPAVRGFHGQSTERKGDAMYSPLSVSENGNRTRKTRTPSPARERGPGGEVWRGRVRSGRAGEVWRADRLGAHSSIGMSRSGMWA